MHVVDLFGCQAVVTGEQDTAAHHVVGDRVSGLDGPVFDTGHRGLAENVARENGTCLDVALLQEDLEVAPGEGRIVAHGERKGEPACTGRRQLPGQNEPFVVVAEESELGGEVPLPRGDVLRELLQLDQSEGGAHFRGLDIEPQLLEHELRVVGQTVEFDVEAVFDHFGLDVQRRRAAPGPQQHRLARQGCPR